MRNLVIFTVSAALAGSASPVQASWQFTQWGMTEDQVLTASHGTVHKATEPRVYTDGSKGLLEGEYISGEFSFQLIFTFNPTGALNGVKLEMPDLSKCTSLNAVVTATFGEAEVSNFMSGKISKWWDEDKGNTVLLSDISDLWCTLSYRPYTKLGQPGNFQGR